ncbi:hypothetical protein MRB53_025818 [Persea americana]|uniref:Uncharacterized protein n=1 Tax=Persea americana TaxID=3435 RepID=A0ACC2LGH5_PERAE|nr:hypothetical protein MRB53_025818 [Persea americana]
MGFSSSRSVSGRKRKGTKRGKQQMGSSPSSRHGTAAASFSGDGQGCNGGDNATETRISVSSPVCNLRWPTRDQNRFLFCNTRSGLFRSPSPVFYSAKMTEPEPPLRLFSSKLNQNSGAVSTSGPPCDRLIFCKICGPLEIRFNGSPQITRSSDTSLLCL